jgi:hypothetical protein
MLWLSDHDALKADRDDNNINTSRNILMTGGGENLDDIMSSNHHDLYYRWKDGLNFTQYLDVLENISKTDLTTVQREFGPYIVLIRKGDGGDIRIYTHTDIFHRRKKFIFEWRAKLIFTFLKRALQERLDHFPALHRVLSSSENYSFPLLFTLNDFWGCLSPDYNAVSTTDVQQGFLYGPQFTLSVSPACDYALPIPSYTVMEMAKNHSTSTEWDEEFRIRDEHYPWENKTRKAFWRGTLSGIGPKFERERLTFVKMAHDDLEIMDVAFFNLDGLRRKRKIRHLVRPGVPMNDFQMYRAIIDIDGNSWSERFPQLLCMNSVVIKIAPAQIDYFWPSLVPGHHFLTATLMNLSAVVRYAVADEHQDEVSKVIVNARSWCRANMVSFVDDVLSFVWS